MTNTVQRRPLIVRIRNWVGDVVLGLPALRLIESHGYELHIVARGKWAPSLLAGYNWPVHVQPSKMPDKVKQLRGFRAQCQQIDAGFTRRDNAFLLPVSLSSALEMRLAGLRAVGVAKEGRSPLLARAEPWATKGHELERYWDIACRFLRVQQAPPAHIDFQVAAHKAAEASQLLASHHITGPFVMICPFAAGRAATADKAEKKWPAFAEFSKLAASRLGAPLIVYPGPGEHASARELYPDALMLEGADLAVYAALLQRAAVVVANDTGPAHMAAALGRPTLSVLGPTEAARWAPWGPGVTVLQKPPLGDVTQWPSADEGLALTRQLLGASK
jgi:heptosyltransferase II